MVLRPLNNPSDSLEKVVEDLKKNWVDVVVYEEKKEIEDVFASKCDNGGSSSAACANSQSCGSFTEEVTKAA